MSLSAKISSSSILLGKSALTAGLILFFLFNAIQDFHRIQKRFPSAFSLANLKVDLKRIDRKCKLDNLNHQIPSFAELKQFLESPSQNHLSPQYLEYYQKVTTYFPTLSEAYALLGLCYDAQNQTKEAVLSFERARQFNPNFFWADYNLGIIYFREGQYLKARQEFHRAVSMAPETTLKAMYSSRIYQQIGLPKPETAIAHLKNTYQRGLKLMLLSEEMLNNASTQRPLDENLRLMVY